MKRNRKIKLLNANTPLAQALLGHKVGDEIEFRVKEKIKKVVILGIH